MKKTKPEDCLVVAADYKPEEHGGIAGVKKKFLELCEILRDTNVYIKGNSILRACGYSLITKVHDLGLRFFADLKLIDIPTTMGIDAQMLREVKPEIVTVMSCAGVAGMKAVEAELRSCSEVLGVTVLTTMDDEECQAIFSCSSKEGVEKFALMAQEARLPGLILSSKENEIIKANKELFLSLNNPGIRPEFSLGKIENDDQKRVVTPKKAIVSGARRIVIGRPITLAENPREAVLKILDEISQGLEESQL